MLVSSHRVVARFLRKGAASPTKEMRDWFEKRTDKHIKGVQKYCQKIEDYDPDKFKGLTEQAKAHDQSKFKKPEIEPYVYITWQYKCKDDGVEFKAPKGVDDAMNKATQHHVKHNRHHPEFHCDKDAGLINRGNRDKPPSEIIDATKMPVLDIGEMVADWLAMSEEKNSNPKDWADKNVNVRWKFTDKQKRLIYQLISDIWDAKRVTTKIAIQKLQIHSHKVDVKATEYLRKTKLQARNRGDLQSAVLSAGYYAKKLGKIMSAYLGDSFGHSVWRVSYKESDYLNPINNSGRRLLSVSPDLTVTWHEIAER